MLQRAFRSHLYPFIRDICCYSLHASFNKAAKQGFHKLGEGGGPDHGLLPLAKYWHLWPCGSCVKEMVSGVTFKKLLVMNNKLLINY